MLRIPEDFEHIRQARGTPDMFRSAPVLRSSGWRESPDGCSPSPEHNLDPVGIAIYIFKRVELIEYGVDLGKLAVICMRPGSTSFIGFNVSKYPDVPCPNSMSCLRAANPSPSG